MYHTLVVKNLVYLLGTLFGISSIVFQTFGNDACFLVLIDCKSFSMLLNMS